MILLVSSQGDDLTTLDPDSWRLEYELVPMMVL